MGLKEGDEIITQANTFVATVLGASNCGASVVLVDCHPDTYMMDHTPNVTGAAGKEGMAFAVGYIRALIQVVYADELRRSVEDPPTYANPRL